MVIVSKRLQERARVWSSVNHFQVPSPPPLLLRYTISGRDEKTLMKMIVHVESDRVVGVHMCVPFMGSV